MSRLYFFPVPYKEENFVAVVKKLKAEVKVKVGVQVEVEVKGRVKEGVKAEVGPKRAQVAVVVAAAGNASAVAPAWPWHPS